VTVHVLAPRVVHVAPPGLATAVYPVIGLAPSDTGADHESETCPFPGVVVFNVGAPGTVRGVADTEFDAGPLPAAFAAVTVNEYGTPFVRPMTVQPSVPPVEQVAPPGLAVAV
jgi:hypothetical protein